MSQEQIDISVVMLTYFHENYIAQALDSVLSQETDLRYEILIGDDASGDCTPDIIREYAARYPDIVRPVLRTENLGANRNGWDLGHRARGKYIAYLEGDDFWLDPQKNAEAVGVPGGQSEVQRLLRQVPDCGRE